VRWRAPSLSLRRLGFPLTFPLPTLPLPQHFHTRTMQELEQLQKAKVYTTTLIRVQMPDRTVLQGTFSPLVRGGA
jgi:hypothetical protein